MCSLLWIDMTLQLNEISSPTGNVQKTYSNKSFVWKEAENIVIPPNSQEVSNCKLTNDELPIDTNAIKELLPNFECKTDLRLTSTLAVWTQTANCR